MIDLILDFKYILLGLLFATIDLRLAFAFTMKVVRDKRDLDELNAWQKVVAACFLWRDVVYNFTWASLLFLELPSWKRKTLTARLKHILFSAEYEETEWRYKLAIYMCKYWIEPHDPGHCALFKLER